MLDFARKSPPGSFVEVGVYKGGTAWHLARFAEIQGRSLYLYDTFCGIPYQSEKDSHRVGDFSDTSAESVRKAIPSAKVIEGVFPESAVDMGIVAFAHIDCDQYQSTFEAIDYLLPHMVNGGRLWFDDSPCLDSARAAVVDIFGDHATIVQGKHTIEIVHGVESRRPAMQRIRQDPVGNRQVHQG